MAHTIFELSFVSIVLTIGYLTLKKHHNLAFCGVILLCLVLKIYCSSDPYLHPWDERCHALVAKHLIDHPLKPTLIEHPVEPFDHKNWIGNHIWLMKPPLPLWLIAVSLKSFGINEYSVRIPGVILATLSVLLTFLIAKKYFGYRVAILASLLHGIHGLLTDLSAGRLSSDSVETCFLFFVELGVYSILLKERNEYRLKHYVLTGFITGLAFMSKWQPALIVLLLMFIYHYDKKELTKHLFFSAISLCVCLLVISPWIMYAYAHYRVELTWMFHAVLLPLTNNPAKDTGEWYYYLRDFGNFFGYSTFLLIILFANKLWLQKPRLVLILLIYACLPVAIFSFAEIKRGPYIFLGAPAIFIIIAQMCMNAIQIKNSVVRTLTQLCGFISVVSILLYSLEKLYLFDDTKFQEPAWSVRIKQTNFSKDTIIYSEPHNLELMFYHDVTAYDFPKKSESE